MSWGNVLSGLIGVVAGLLLRNVVARWRSIATAQALAVALWEELQAVEFRTRDDGTVTFAGFSSQVFDSLFADIAHLLPEDLSRKVMRYHWRMKYLDDTQDSPWSGWHRLANEAQEQHGQLVCDLESFEEGWRPLLFLNRSWY